MLIFSISRKEWALLQAMREYAARFDLASNVIDLKQQLATLEIEKGKIKEQHEREERELRHMIGLEKKRQEFEIQQAKSETGLKIREENLAADRKRFEEQMKFHEDRFTKEVDYLKELMADILERLPNISANFDTVRRK